MDQALLPVPEGEQEVYYDPVQSNCLQNSTLSRLLCSQSLTVLSLLEYQ